MRIWNRRSLLSTSERYCQLFVQSPSLYAQAVNHLKCNGEKRHHWATAYQILFGLNYLSHRMPQELGQCSALPH